ncbi:WD repeat-containing protein 87-like [Branchiostoma lanceolatum]|uniref:WD repeat-containing protein 87-like n=1 Tax=Branchiostoma lanceolatum TaxID=7740 RepID=UPI0034571978
MALTTRKLRPWKDVQLDIQKKLKNWNSQRNADNVTIPYGLQLEHNLSHPNPVRCMSSQRILTGDIFVANQGVGVTNQLYLWNIDADTNGAELKKYPVTPAMTLMKCIPKVHALVGYCSSDMTINIFTDMLHGFKQLSMSPMPTTVLSMAFLDDTDELVLGTVGSLLTFRLGMFDIRAKLVPSRPFITDLTREQWVLNLQVDRRTRQLIAMCDDGVFFINYSSRMQERFLPNWHQADLSCCIAYRPKEYFITAATDGTMKVWNSIVFSQVHEFMGHYNHITGLALHPRYPLLVSGSRDGSIRVWRLDTLEQTYRLDIGDDILEMSMLGSGTIFYRTKHQIKVWYLNQFHSTFSHVYCSVNKLVRINWVGLPSRVLVTGEDGSVRILSAVSGVVLNIIYPMATYQVLDNLVYDPSANKIFAVLKDGEVLVYDSSTNPCMPRQLLCPGSDDEQVLSAALVKMELALGQDDTTAGKAVVFAGHKNGQLSLLHSPDQLKMHNIQAHSGQVSFLYSSHGKPDHGILGSVSRLVSCGTDKCVHIWGIGVEEDTIRLVCLSTVQCKVRPMLISMVGNILALVTTDGVLSMYKTYTKEEMALEKTTYMSASSCAVQLTHHIEDDHKKGVTALCCSRTLDLFATTGKDACVKIWNTENKLVKELVLDNTLQGVCFANDRGDLLIGYQSHVSYVPLLNYLPKLYLEELVETDVLDEQLEEPVPYDPSLQLLFTMDSIPVFPLDLKARREMELEASLSVPATQVSERDLPIIPLSTKTSSFLSIQPSSHLRQSTSARTLASQTTQVAASPIRLSPPLETMETIPSRVQEEEEDVAKEKEVVPTDTMPVESKSNQFTEKDRKKGLEKEEEEDPLLKRKPIIAPDGYIPNSVIRFIIGYKPPPERFIQQEWKLKAAPSGALPDVEEEEEEEEAEDEEGLVIDWSSSPELDLKEDDERWKLPSPVRFGEKKEKPREQKPGPKLDYTFRKVNFGPPSRDELESPSSKKAKPAKEKKEWEGPTLLRNIINCSWFPRDKLTDQKLTVENVMAILLTLLQDTSDIDRHKKVCQAITDIHKELGLGEELLDTVVKILLGQLGKRNAIIRRNAVRTLGELGLDRKVILLALISALADNDKVVQKEALNAIVTVAGVKTKHDLAQMLQQVGVLKEPVKNKDRQNLKELEERVGKKAHGQALQDSLSEMNARIAMWNERIDQRHASPPLDMDFLDFMNKEDQLDKKSGGPSKGAPQLSRKQKERGLPSSKAGRKTTMSFKRHAKSRPKRPQPKTTVKHPSSRVKGDLASGKKWTMLHHNQAIRKMLIAKDLEESSSPVGMVKETVTAQDQSRYLPEVPRSSRSESPADCTRHVAKVTNSATKAGHRELSDADTASISHRKEVIDDKSVCHDDDTVLGTDDATSTAPTDDVASTAPTVEELELRLRRTFTDDYAATESSYDDSGLGQMSDTSSYMDGFRVRKPMQTHYFPPIKSGIPFELRSDSDKSFSSYKEEEDDETTEKWRRLFNRPAAQRRKQLYEERAQKLSGQGASAKQSALPPIVYVNDMKRLTKGDLGQRLLLSVATHFAPEARQKLEGRDRHRITSLPHKLGSHTDVESYGCSNFGTLNMLWTTMAPQRPEIPVLYPHNSTFAPTKDGAYGQRQRKKPFHVPLPSLEMLTRVQAIQESGLLKEKSFKKTFSRSYPSSTTYSWSTPLPPARNLNSTLRKLELSEVDLSAKPAAKVRCGVHKRGHRCKVCQGYYSSPELAASRPDSEEDPAASAAPPPSRAEVCKVISLPILA